MINAGPLLLKLYALFTNMGMSVPIPHDVFLSILAPLHVNHNDTLLVDRSERLDA